MYEACHKKVDLQRPSTFLRKRKLTWTPRIYWRNAASKVITSTHTAFRDRAELFDQLTKSDEKLYFIDCLIKEAVANVMLREKFRKGIEDKLPMKEEFDEWSYFLRETSEKMDDNGKVNDAANCVATATPHFRSAPLPMVFRGRGTHAGHEHGRRNVNPQERRGPLLWLSGRHRRPSWRSLKRYAHTALETEKYLHIVAPVLGRGEVRGL